MTFNRYLRPLWLPALMAMLLGPPGVLAAQKPATQKPGQTSPAAVKAGPASQRPVPAADDVKLDRTLRGRSRAPMGRSRVIITMRDGQAADAVIQSVRGVRGRRLRLLGAHAAEVSDAELGKLARDPRVLRVDHDRPTFAMMERSGATIGTSVARSTFGLDGAGIGVAVIDSGVTGWHDDLTAGAVSGDVQLLSVESGDLAAGTFYGTSSEMSVGLVEPAYPRYGMSAGQRVVQFVDFVAGQPYAYDDYGHGTHVAGIIAGNGYDSSGARTGVAPGASIVALKALNGTGGGYISDVIAALDYAVANKDLYNIRVINLSVGASITQSYTTDPLTLAAKRAVRRGHCRRGGGRQSGQEPSGAAAVRRHHGAGQRALGAHGRRVEPHGHDGPRR